MEPCGWARGELCSRPRTPSWGNSTEIQITWRRGTATGLRWGCELCDLWHFLLSVTLETQLRAQQNCSSCFTGESSLEKVFGGARLEVRWPRCWRRENGNCGVGRSSLFRRSAVSPWVSVQTYQAFPTVLWSPPSLRGKAPALPPERLQALAQGHLQWQKWKQLPWLWNHWTEVSFNKPWLMG